MALWFHTMSAARILRRRRGPVVRMVLTALVGSLWCVVGTAWILAQWRDTDDLASAARLEVFVQTDSTHAAVRDAAVVARRISGVHDVKITESADVYRSLITDLEIAEADLAQVVQLPDQLSIRVEPMFCTVADMERIAGALQRSSSAVLRVAQPTEYVSMLERRRHDLIVLGSVAAGLSAIMFLIAIFYAFRAEVHAAAADLSIGTALGAGSWFMAAPHIMISFLAGGFGLLVASGGFLFAKPELSLHIAPIARVTDIDIAVTTGVIAVIGAILTVGQSWWAVRRAVNRS